MNNTECQFEELVSAEVDGELSVSEEIALREHLANCDSCSRRLHQFRSIDREIHNAHMPAQPVLLRESPLVSHGPDSRWNRKTGGHTTTRSEQKNGRALLFGGTAVALAGIAAVVAISQRSVESPGIAWTAAVEPAPQVQDVVAPLSRLAVNNQKSKSQQKQLARSLELQLRTLKLDVRNSTTDPTQLKKLESDIDALIQQLKNNYTVPAEPEQDSGPAAAL